MSKVIDLRTSPLVLEWLEKELEGSLNEPFISKAWEAEVKTVLSNIKKEDEE